MTRGDAAGLRSYSQQIGASSAEVEQGASALQAVRSQVGLNLFVPGASKLMGSITHTENAMRAHAQLRQGLQTATKAVAEAVEHAQHCDHAKQVAQDHLNRANAKMFAAERQAEAADRSAGNCSVAGHGSGAQNKAQADLKSARHEQQQAQHVFDAKNRAAQVADQDRMTCISRYRNLCEQEANALHASVSSVYAEANQMAPPPLRKSTVQMTNFLTLVQMEQAAQRIKQKKDAQKKAKEDDWGVFNFVPHFIRHFSDGFVDGVGDGVSGIVHFGGELVDHPWKTAEGIAKSFEHPGRLLKAIVNPDLFLSNPGKWFGELAPTALLAAGTGGAGGLAEKVAGGSINELEKGGALARTFRATTDAGQKWQKIEGDPITNQDLAAALKNKTFPDKVGDINRAKMNLDPATRRIVDAQLRKAHLLHGSSKVIGFGGKTMGRAGTATGLYELGTRNDTNYPGWLPDKATDKAFDTFGSYAFGPK